MTVLVVAAGLSIANATAAAAAPSARGPARASSAPFRPGSGQAVPKGFRATAITWTSAERGFVLGSAPCAASRPPRPASSALLSQPSTCSYLTGTTNGGSSWSVLGSVPANIATIGQTGEQGVTQIRFANAKVGWAYGPSLLRTTNGGRTWTPMAIPGGGQQVVDVAAGSSGVYAVVSPCQWYEFDTCLEQPFTFWRNSSLTGAWTRIPLNVATPKGMLDLAAGVAVRGRTVYALRSIQNVAGTVFRDKLYASTDGVHFSVRPDPCDTRAGLSLSQAVPTSVTGVALLCQFDIGGGSAAKQVYRSADTGQTDTSAGLPSFAGIDPQLAASPSGNLAVTSSSGASFIDINDTGGTRWLQVAEVRDGGFGWNGIVYSTGKEAWVVHAPAEDTYPFAPGQVFVSRDGGRHWRIVTL